MNAFCEDCREYNEYQIRELDRIKKIKGVAVHFKEKVAYCLECDNEIFVSELRDENLATIEDKI
ncbi:MAG TPA: hypothetical protein VJ958_02600 [Atribacterota bacterium]|nr:hypothetical protein [Atribacterota bacterium]